MSFGLSKAALRGLLPCSVTEALWMAAGSSDPPPENRRFEWSGWKGRKGKLPELCQPLWASWCLQAMRAWSSESLDSHGRMP